MVKPAANGATRRRAKAPTGKPLPRVKVEPCKRSGGWASVRRKPAAGRHVVPIKREPVERTTVGQDAVVVKREPVEPAASAPALVAPSACVHSPKKTLPMRRRKGKKPPNGLLLQASFFDDVARQAAELASATIARKMNCPLPLVGDLRCSVAGFEKHLDGIKVDVSWCVFRWRFAYTTGQSRIEGSVDQRHRAGSIYYGCFLPQPPRGIRVAACIVRG